MLKSESRKKRSGEFRLDLRQFSNLNRTDAVRRVLDQMSEAEGGAECRVVSDEDLTQILAGDARITSGRIQIVETSQWNGAHEVLLAASREIESDGGCCGVCGGR